MAIIKNNKYIANEQIKAKELRVMTDDGEQLGIISFNEALEKAEEKELDLVLIAPTANPPVAKIMNLNKFIYEQSKKEKLAKKNQKVIEIKEIRLSATIEDHDIEIKANRASKFLADGDKVKVTVRFRGREADYAFKGNDVLDIFVSKIDSEVYIVEKKAKLEGRNMTMVLAPKKA
ncbi:translation initiation factor IF-3 [Clostridium cellulovorans]|uniref:Translation initiation factor IF-3 n=1 Tax=Clostridium cellulovorans (strain ATCC 35296 / DSM 3052 / OCM 3 / 743B) TaxID=573061 RepID=D9SM18_CLOC7|nr:translation initiation factor IF-3 [Clostridium cellulovorans]ADL51749.1 translation initiation factor IF-3 [Clostridium cellulovorans 743B]